jgi:uncharacterized protein
MTSDLELLRARIAAITARVSPRAPHRPVPERPVGLLDRLPADCVTEATPFGPVAVKREWISEEGDPDVSALSRCLGFAPDDLRRPLFLDTETTGISGGTGIVAFLVGLGWRDGAGLALAQYFLCDLDQEDALLWAVGQYVSDAGVLVSYNGRSFDWPLLQTRLVMRRVDPAWPSPPHLDLLTLARRIFRPRLPDCALQTIEQAVLDLHRADDLPGTLIPSRYFAWLRGRQTDVLDPVFVHNRQDVLSMVLLLARLEEVLRDADDLHPLDRFGRARFMESRGFESEAIGEYWRLWREATRTSTGTLRGSLGLRLARLLRRAGRWTEARAVLEECWRSQSYPYPAAIELAKLLEHQLGDHRAARRLVGDALNLLALAVVANPQWRADLERRRARLDRRLGGWDRSAFALTG